MVDEIPRREHATHDVELTQWLAQCVRGGEMDRFQQLYERVMPALHAWAMLRIGARARVDPEEVLQETWLRALARFPLYDAERSFRAWIFGVAKNVLLESLRRSRQAGGVSGGSSTMSSWLAAQPDVATSISLRAARRDAMERFLERVRTLGEDEQTLLRMCGLEGATSKEAALRLGIGEEAAKKRWLRLRTELIARDMPRDLLSADE